MSDRLIVIKIIEVKVKVFNRSHYFDMIINSNIIIMEDNNILH